MTEGLNFGDIILPLLPAESITGAPKPATIELIARSEIDLSPEDIAPANRLGITKVSLINAMLPLESAPVIPISEIYFT